LLEHGDGIAGAHAVAFVLEQALQAAGRERAEPHLANLHGAGHTEGVAGVAARCGREQRECRDR